MITETQSAKTRHFHRPNALGIAAASFAREALAERAKIERKARRRSRNAQRELKIESGKFAVGGQLSAVSFVGMRFIASNIVETCRQYL